jgi:hypothetical protein
MCQNSGVRMDDYRGAEPTVITRRWPRRFAIGSATVAGATMATTTAGGWYYANELLRVQPDPREYTAQVLALTQTTVTLAGADADQRGVFGLQWPGGYARVGPDVTVIDGRAVRDLTPYPRTPAVGAKVRMDYYAMPADLAAFSTVGGFSATEIHYDGPLGRYPATYVDSPGRRWMIHVHGRGGSREAGYRVAPVIHGLGHPQLFVTYRNDIDAPADGRYGLGWTESEDLSAAIGYARERGAEDFVLVGYSMGGSIIGNYLRTHGSGGVVGVIYDSPALSWPDILASQAKNRGLPGFGATVAAATVRLRTGINVWAMDQVAHADRLDVPVLLIHGDQDADVPVTSSDSFAAARPDLVTYLRTDAEHCRSWNVNPARYEAAVTVFLSSLP